MYGILRTMVGNDANLDMLQLGHHLTGTTEVSTILAKHPDWDRAPRHLKLPSLSKDGVIINNHVDHINPGSWRGNVKVSDIVLQTCWKLGRHMMETEFPFLEPVLQSITHSLDIFSPLGIDLIKGSHALDDLDDTLDAPPPGQTSTPSHGMDLKDAIMEEHPEKHDSCFELDGKQIYKA